MVFSLSLNLVLEIFCQHRLFLSLFNWRIITVTFVPKSRLSSPILIIHCSLSFCVQRCPYRRGSPCIRVLGWHSTSNGFLCASNSHPDIQQGSCHLFCSVLCFSASQWQRTVGFLGMAWLWGLSSVCAGVKGGLAPSLPSVSPGWLGLCFLRLTFSTSSGRRGLASLGTQLLLLWHHVALGPSSWGQWREGRHSLDMPKPATHWKWSMLSFTKALTFIWWARAKKLLNA